jgi:hypothetical protein
MMRASSAIGFPAGAGAFGLRGWVVLLLMAGWVALAAPAAAQSAGEVSDALADALGLDRMVEVVGREGEQNGEDLAAELFPDAPSGRWAAEIARIHARDALRTEVRAGFARAVAGNEDAARALLAALSEPRIARIVERELAAREIIGEPEVEDLAAIAFEELQAEGDPLIGVIERIVLANDLVERNVMGAMNASLAFYRGVAEGGGMPGAVMSEAEMLAEVQGQEDAMRAEIEGWLYPYLVLAYRDLPLADLEAYADLAATPEGQFLNRMLFEVFDTLFERLSRETGRAAGRFLASSDL